MENPSFLLAGPENAYIQDRPIPKIVEPNDVIIQIAYTGVCGSDTHFWLQGGIRTYVSQEKPLTMGHEASGTVYAVGNSVKHLVPGDRVAIEPGIPCRCCRYCKAGTYNLCRQIAFAADPPNTHGTLTKFYATAADFCYKIPDQMSLAEAVLIEPLAVAVHSVRLSGLMPGQSIVVFGAGTVGLLCVAVAKAFGASVIVSVDLLAWKLEIAKLMAGQSLCRTFVPDTALSPHDTASRLVENTGLGLGAHVVIDATGAESSVQTAMYTLAPGGTYVQTGMGKRNIDFPIAELCERELVVKGCYRYGSGDFDLALQLAKDGAITLRCLISREFPFEDAIEAWKATQRGEGVKNMIKGPLD